jgi:hypothetical protein
LANLAVGHGDVQPDLLAGASYYAVVVAVAPLLTRWLAVLFRGRLAALSF